MVNTPIASKVTRIGRDGRDEGTISNGELSIFCHCTIIASRPPGCQFPVLWFNTAAMAHDPEEIIRFFQLDGKLLGIAPCGSGHINDTYASSFRVDGQIVRYVHQWINQHV